MRGVLGVRRILEQDPYEAPVESKRGPAPFVHAASVGARVAFRIAYEMFVEHTDSQLDASDEASEQSFQQAPSHRLPRSSHPLRLESLGTSRCQKAGPI